MIEGWHCDEYYILLSREEAFRAAHIYDLPRHLPDYGLVGVRSWDEFIVQSPDSRLFTVPTVPVASAYLKPLVGALPQSLHSDPERLGKIKWYLTPIAFGGSPDAPENIVWVSHTQHAELVRWWNSKFVETIGGAH